MLESPYSAMQSCAIEQLYNFLSLFDNQMLKEEKSVAINEALIILTETPWQDFHKIKNLEADSLSSNIKKKTKLEELLL